MARNNAREKIIEAADRLFGKRGFDAASTREIALASGVNKALIHYHFKSKEELFESVLDRYYERLNAVLLETMKENGTPRQKLARLIDVYVDFLADNLGFSRIVQRESSGGPHMDRIVSHLLPVFRAGVDMVNASYPATRKTGMSAPHLIVSFYGMIVSYFTYSGVLEGLAGKDPLSKAELRQRKKHLHLMLDIVLDSIGNGGATGQEDPS